MTARIARFRSHMSLANMLLLGGLFMLLALWHHVAHAAGADVAPPDPAALAQTALDPHAARLMRILSACFALVLLVRKYGAALFPVLESRRSGVVLAFLMAALGAAIEGAVNGWNWGLLLDSVLAGAGAIGVWTSQKNLRTGESRAALDTSVAPAEPKAGPNP